MTAVWCVNCKDEFDATEVSDTETPLCSDLCQDQYNEMIDNSEEYDMSRGTITRPVESVYHVAVDTPFGVWQLRISGYSVKQVQEAAANYVLRQDRRVSRSQISVL